MQITITATSIADLTAQLRQMLGEFSPAPTPAPVVSAHVGRTLPAWAAPGSRWMELPGAPALIGPDGQPVPVAWTPDGPQPGVATQNHDAAAEAAGAALLKSLGG